MRKSSNYKYNPRSLAQKQFLQADCDSIYETLLTGPGGTGKTISFLISSLGPIKNSRKLLVDNPSYVGLVIRREAVTLEKSGLIDAAKEWYGKMRPGVSFNSVHRVFEFPSGAKIWFRGCESEDDAFKFKGYTKLHFVGFEELTQFTQMQYEFISTRVRDGENKDNIPIRIRATTNAGDKGEDWVLEKFKYWLWQSSVNELDTPIKAEYGQVLYSYTDDSNYENQIKFSIEKPKQDYKTVICVATDVNDVDPKNAEVLSRISDIKLRNQLLHHKWGLKAEAGQFFQQDWFQFTENKENGVRLRYWDLAASGNKGDYLASVLVCKTRNHFIVEDIFLKKAQVHEIENIILNYARREKGVIVGIEQEGGSGSKILLNSFEVKLRELGIRFRADNKTLNRNTSTKISRAALVSPIAKEGRILIIENENYTSFIKQLIEFPLGKNDDCVDALTGAIYLLRNEHKEAPQFNQMNRFIKSIDWSYDTRPI